MAAGRLPKPGTKHGPCEGACKHLDCAEVKREAELICRLCKDPIGFERGFFRMFSRGPLGELIEGRDERVHSSCAYDESESKRNATPPGASPG
jgi:hypothetical protein